MAKDKISDYSSTANSNTDIAGINIDEGCAPSGINDAIRTLMAQLKTWQSGGQDIYITPAGSASVPAVTTTGDTNTGVFFPAADTVGITTGGTERARVDSSGNLGLGVTPSAWTSTRKAFQVSRAALVGRDNYAVVSANWYNNDGTDRYIATDYASQYVLQAGGHTWYNAASGTAGNAITFTQAMTLDASGGLKTLNTIGVGNTAPSTSGAGITFPATQSASTDANTLDDYEEGTWTPNIGSSAGGESGQIYNFRQGLYTKIGRLVFVSFDIDVNTEGTFTAGGGATIYGLPFGIPNTGDLRTGGGSIGYVAGLGASYVSQGLYPQNNSSYLFITARTAASTSMIPPDAATFWANGTRITGMCCYQI